MKKRRRKETFSDRFWLDKQGRLSVWQKPNIFLTAWLVTLLIQIALGASNSVSNIARIIGTVSIAIWALLEVIKGVSYFRQTLGACVLVLMAFIYLI